MKGYRLEKPDECPDAVYRLMVRCWEAEPSNRIHFSDLVISLGDQVAAVSSPVYETQVGEPTSKLMSLSPITLPLDINQYVVSPMQDDDQEKNYQ